MRKNKYTKILISLLCLAMMIPLLGNGKIEDKEYVFNDYVYNERYAQPTNPSGVGTVQNSTNTFWNRYSISLMAAGVTTISDGYTTPSSGTRLYSTTATIDYNADREVIFEISTWVLYANGTSGWANTRAVVMRKGFTPETAISIGSSLIDNLLSEPANNTSLMTTLSKQSNSGWINTVLSGRPTSGTHAVYQSGKLYKHGNTTFTNPTRAYYTIASFEAGYANNTATRINTVKMLKDYYFDIAVTIPKLPELDNVPPSISANPTSRGWGSTNVGVTLTFSDDESGINNSTRRYKWTTSTAVPTSWDTYSSALTLASNGTYYLHARVSDNKGNTTTSRFGPYRRDNVSPTVVSSSLTGHQYQNGNDYWFAPGRNFTFNNMGYDGHAGIQHQYIRLSGNTDIRAHHDWSAASTHFNPWVKANGAVITGVTRSTNSGGNRRLLWTGTTQSYNYDYNVQYYYNDGAGNTVGYNNSGIRLRIDSTAPTAPSISLSNTGWSNANVTVTINHGSDTRSGVNRSQYRIGTGAWTNYTAPFAISTAGVTQISARTIDNVGHISGTTTRNVSIDRTAPTGTITGNPTAWTNSNATLTFTATDTGGSGVRRVRVSGGTWVAGSTTTQIATANGAYSFEVEDNAGNTSTRTVNVTRIDKSAPTGTITGNPTAWTNSNATLTFTATDTGGSGVRRVRVSGGTWVTGSTTTQIATANGTYSFQAEDNAGNTSTVTVNVTRIDKIAPTGTITGNPTAWTNANVTLTITTSDTGGSGYYRTALPNGTFSTSAAPTFTVATNGTYTFTVYDNAGNSRAVSVTVTRIDKTAPSLGLVSSNTAWTNNFVNIRVTASDSESGLDSVVQTSPLLPGQNYASRTDINETSSNYGFGNTTLTQNLVAGTTYTVTFNGYINPQAQADGKQLRLYVYEPTWTRGSHSYPITSTTATTVSFSFTPSWTGAWRINSYMFPSGGSRAGAVTLNWIKLEEGTSSTGKSFNPTTEISNGSNVPAYINGTYSFRATDNAGNIRNNSISIGNVDRTPPTPASLTMNPTSWTNGNVTVSLTHGTDAGSGIARSEYKIGSGPWQTYTAPFSISTTGITTVYARSIDRAGNISLETSKNTYIDRTSPTAPTINRSRTGWGSTKGTFTLTHGTDGQSGVNRSEYRIGTGAWTTYTGQTIVHDEGIVSISARTIDNVGNISPIVTAPMHNDFSPPTVSANPSSSDWVNTGVNVTLTYSDPLSGVGVRQYRWSTSTATPMTWDNYTGPVSQSGQGIWYLHFRTVDAVGNVATGRFGPYRVKREDGLSVKNVKVTPNTVNLEPNMTSLTRAVSVSFRIENRIFPNHGNPINPSVTIRYGPTLIWSGKVQVPSNGATTRNILIPNVTIVPGRNITVEVNGDRAFAEYHYTGVNPYADNIQSVPLIARLHNNATSCIIPNPSLPFTVHDRNTWREEWTKITQTATLSGDYFINANRVTASTIQSYEETFRILSVEFRSKYTSDNKNRFSYINSDGWQTINRPGFPESNTAKIKAGYGFELRVVVEYRTNRHVIPTGYTESFSNYVNSSTYGQGYANYTVVSPSFIPVKLPTAIYFDIDGHNNCYQLVPVAGEVVTETSQWHTVRRTYEIEETSKFGFGILDRRLYIPQNAKPNTHTVTVRTPFNQDTAFGGYTEDNLVAPSAKTFLRDMMQFELEILGQDDIKSHFGN